jgi:hypothetical protein
MKAVEVYTLQNASGQECNELGRPGMFATVDIRAAVGIASRFRLRIIRGEYRQTSAAPLDGGDFTA